MPKQAVSLLFVVIWLVSGCMAIDSEIIRDASERCIVEQHDLETGRLAVRLEFVEAGLLLHQIFYGADHSVTRRHWYDGQGRLIRVRKTADFAAGLPEDALPWQVLNGYYEIDVTDVDEATFEYGPSGRVVRVLSKSTNTSAEGVSQLQAFRDYVYDERGRKIARISVHVNPNGSVARMRRDYTYDDKNRLKSLEARSQSPGSSWSYRVTFDYDARGNLIATASSNSSIPSRREYDENDRLISLGPSYGEVFTWDDSGHLVRNALHGIDYTYDEQGRLEAAYFDKGGGYTTSYSSGCPAGFADPSFTPNVDFHLFYEGRNPTLRIW